MFKSCEVAFNKFTNFTNYQPMFETNLKEINLRKLCKEVILIKCVLTFDNSNTH